MASGDTLAVLTPLSNEPPAANYATLDTRNAHPCLDFDATTDEIANFSGIMPRNYDGGGVTVYLHWSASTDDNAAHFCYWDAAFERIAANDLDIDGDGFAAAQSTDDTSPNGTLGKVTITSIAFTNGAQMDSVVAGDLFRLQITRDAATDDMTGDGELLGIEIKET